MESGEWSFGWFDAITGVFMSSAAYLKSKRFAIRIVKLFAFLRDEKKEYVISKQLLRCGTSIGANLAEATCAISRNEFLSKVYIALKETVETLYWLELLYDTGFMTSIQYNSIHKDAEELRLILKKKKKTLKES